jgi:hypothetical protein
MAPLQHAGSDTDERLHGSGNANVIMISLCARRRELARVGENRVPRSATDHRYWSSA